MVPPSSSALGKLKSSFGERLTDSNASEEARGRKSISGDSLVAMGLCDKLATSGLLQEKVNPHDSGCEVEGMVLTLASLSRNTYPPVSLGVFHLLQPLFLEKSLCLSGGDGI
jgi:hypothetical protein